MQGPHHAIIPSDHIIDHTLLQFVAHQLVHELNVLVQLHPPVLVQVHVLEQLLRFGGHVIQTASNISYLTQLKR